MKKIILTASITILSFYLAFSQIIPVDSMYLGQLPPGKNPKVFNLPVTNGLRPVERISISSDNKEIFYSELDQWPPTNSRIKCIKYQNNSWQAPAIIFEGYICPALSMNDSIIYMQKNININDTIKSITFYSRRLQNGWSEPLRLLSSNLQSHYFQETLSKNCYLASTPNNNSDICKLIINNQDTTIQSLNKPINLPSITENDFYVARDESYIIFFRLASPFNLFISYKKNNGKWTNPKLFDSNINTPIYECCPFVTKDNKYLFFTRGGNAMPSYFTYWVKIDNIIDSLKHTNFIPYLNNPILNQTIYTGQQLNFIVADSIFIDDDGNNALSYRAKLSNGNPLPSWLTFDSIAHRFSGTPLIPETLNIKVTVTDSVGASAFTTFKIIVNDLNSINQNNDNKINISPNPTKGILNISLGSYLGKKVIAEICSLDGKTVIKNTLINDTTIDLSNKPKGIYFLKLYIDNEIIVNKFCLD